MSRILKPKYKQHADRVLRRGRFHKPLSDPAVSPRKQEPKAPPKGKSDELVNGGDDVDYSELEDWSLRPTPEGESLHEAVYSDPQSSILPPVAYRCNTCSSIGNSRGICNCCGSGNIELIEPIEPIDHPA